MTITDGQLLEEVCASEHAHHRETHAYDESGREIEKAGWNSDGSNVNRQKYVFVSDDHGNWI
ncbi:MAG TPA: hypothetical protein VGH83_06415 [Candidatus Acidoferrum sp.]